jgi:hypothetical protein
MTANLNQHVTRTHVPVKPEDRWAYTCSCGYHSTGYLTADRAANGARLHREGLTS